MSETKLQYWDPNRTASYNCLLNFIIGNRGAGKTYGSLKRCIQRFLKSGAQFVYMRRTKEELKPLTTKNDGRLFDAVCVEFPENELKAHGNVLYCDGKVMGYGVVLSTSTILKSQTFPGVRDIIFDEFIIDNTRTYHYLYDEVRKWQDAYETIARPGNDPDRPDTRAWFLSNAVTISNPYFAEYGLMPPQNGDIQRFGRTRDILVQNVANESLTNAKKESRFGRIVSGTDYASYAYDNEWLLDNDTFVERKTQRSDYYMSLRYMDRWYGIWYDKLQGLYYVSDNVNLQYPIQASATTDDHLPNTMLFKSRSNAYFNRLRVAYENGWIRYESIRIKNVFRQIMARSY